jgi:hypothetical protein
MAVFHRDRGGVMVRGSAPPPSFTSFTLPSLACWSWYLQFVQWVGRFFGYFLHFHTGVWSVFSMGRRTRVGERSEGRG